MQQKVPARLELEMLHLHSQTSKPPGCSRNISVSYERLRLFQSVSLLTLLLDFDFVGQYTYYRRSTAQLGIWTSCSISYTQKKQTKNPPKRNQRVCVSLCVCVCVSVCVCNYNFYVLSAPHQSETKEKRTGKEKRKFLPFLLQ